jgi:ferredoxin--NADP+ reductase
MFQLGTCENPLRLAVIGAGPSGFYVAEHLLKQQDLTIELDMIERLPTPYGLVRGGVAPDHQKIKAVAHAYDKTAANPRFRYYGNVEFGAHVKLDALQRFYHQIVFTTGAQAERRMGIPGEDLVGSHATMS